MKTITSNKGGIAPVQTLDDQAKRDVYRVINTHLSQMGELQLRRAFSGEYTNYVSPFHVLDEFGPMQLAPGTPFRVDAHPHAGIIPMTYLLDGDSHHRDSLGNDIQYSKGDLLIFTAGKGALHMEETGAKLFERGGRFHGFQSWLNIPSHLKRSEPFTELLEENTIPTINTETYSLKVLLGEAFGLKSRARMLFPVLYLHVNLQAGASLELPVDRSQNAFIYVVDGEIEVSSGTQVGKGHVVLYERNGDMIRIKSHTPANILVLGGAPNNERYVAYGPFIMNTQNEIAACFKDFERGKMGDPAAVDGY